MGFIGCGGFAYSTLAHFLVREQGYVIKRTMDLSIDRAASLAHRYRASSYSTEANDIFEDDNIDLVFIASNHASHADYAIRALAADKHVHLEKPHVVSEEQLYALCEAARRSRGKISLGFNRPVSPLGRRAVRLMREGSGPRNGKLVCDRTFPLG